MHQELPHAIGPVSVDDGMHIAMSMPEIQEFPIGSDK
jgi:hypothetical protein